MGTAPCPRCSNQTDEASSQCQACGYALSSNWSDAHRKAKQTARTRWLLRAVLATVLGIPALTVLFASPSYNKQEAGEIDERAKVSMAPATSLPRRCTDQGHRDWISECDRAVTWRKVLFPLEEEPHRLTLEIDAAGTVRLLGLTPRDYYLRFYTRAPQTYGVFDGVALIPDPHFWRNTDRGLGVKVLPQGKVITFRYSGDRHWETSAQDAIGLIKSGTEIEFPARDKTVRLSLLGATAAIEALPRASVDAPVQTNRAVIAQIGAKLGGNRFKVTEEDLRITPNPRGAGLFVYVPKTDYFGVERKFIWFANAGEIAKLNGATHSLSPSLPWPREAAFELWNESNLSSESVLSVGLTSAF